MMVQYLSLKEAHQDCLLLYRMGDFYELFFEDAEVAAAALNIALTTRGRHTDAPIPMCGVPHHSVDQYLAKLIAAGHRVALCEQTEDPAAAKKRGGHKTLVDRKVVRIFTPGTLTEEAHLQAAQATYLAAISQAGDQAALAWLDLSTGVFEVQALPPRRGEIEAALAALDPSELLAADSAFDLSELGSVLAGLGQRLTLQPATRFSSRSGQQRLQRLFDLADLTVLGDFSRAEIAAAGALLDYVDLTQKAAKPLIKPLKQRRSQVRLAIDAATRQNLELTKTLAGKRVGSLLANIDETLTGAGARLLADRLSSPSAEGDVIARRHDSLIYLLSAPDLLTDSRSLLKDQPDVARTVQRLSLGRGGPRDMRALVAVLSSAAALKSLLTSAHNRLPLQGELIQVRDNLGEFSALHETLDQTLKEEVPLLARDGGFVRSGFRADLDEQLRLRDDSRKLIAQMQADLVTQTGITSLKIRHNNVLGYFIEVTAANADKIPSGPETGFIHRQTLGSATRYTTVALSGLDDKIRAAGDLALTLERAVFDELRDLILSQAAALLTLAEALALIDVIAALAQVAQTRGWVRPEMRQDRYLRIEGGRHPVVEFALQRDGASPFIANDLVQSPEDHIWLLTGPNMAGKSTYLRQNALIIVLAQMGAYVPAAHAEIGLIDRLFSRVGASDDLASGRSTFMVEMIETALILNQATERSFVILDEMGRGTATFDGLSLAWATVEYLANQIGCRALFATHYHELTALADRLPALSCHSFQVKEWEGEVIFLHSIAPGAADRSYGIHVGKLAGLPASVIARAQEVLDRLESEKERSSALSADLPLFAITPSQAAASQPNLVLARLRDVNIDALSPRGALNLLYELQDLSSADL